MAATTQATPPTLYFRSTLTCNGRKRPLPIRSETFLRHDGAILAAVLRSETALSLEEIFFACQEYLAEHPEMTTLDVPMLNTLLTRFVFLGLAAASPHPTGGRP